MQESEKEPAAKRVSRWDLKVHVSEVISAKSLESKKQEEICPVIAQSDQHVFQSIQAMLQSQSVIDLLQNFRYQKSFEEQPNSPSCSTTAEEKTDSASAQGDFFSSILQTRKLAGLPLIPDQNLYSTSSMASLVSSELKTSIEYSPINFQSPQCSSANDSKSPLPEPTDEEKPVEVIRFDLTTPAGIQHFREMQQCQLVSQILEKINGGKIIENLPTSSSCSSHSEEKTEISASAQNEFFSTILQTGSVPSIPLSPDRNPRILRSVEKAWLRFCRTLKAKKLPPPVISPVEVLRFLTCQLVDSQWQTCFEAHEKRQNMMNQNSISLPKTDKEIWDRFNNQKVPEKFRRNFIVHELLQKPRVQCKLCSFKFGDPSRDNQEMKDHMDAHLRERLKELPSTFGSGPSIAPAPAQWYPSAGEWLPKNKNVEKQHLNVLVSETVDKKCPVCHEDFEQFFDEKDDSWKYKNSMGHSGTVIHFSCLSDFERSISRASEEVHPPTPEDVITVE